jgi:hypothetical protein
MLDITEFMTRFPAPPRLPRGVPKHTFSVVLNEQEWLVVQKLANHEQLRGTYNGHQSDVVRHALYYFLMDLEPSADSNLSYIRNQLIQLLNHDAFLHTREMISQYLDLTGNILNELIDFGEITGSLDEYEQHLTKLSTLPTHWRRVVNTLSKEHPEMERYLSRMEKSGLEYTLALKEITERIGE